MTELKTIQSLVELLTGAERRRLAVLVLLLVVTGGLEILGLSTMFIFTGVLSELSSGTVTHFRLGSFDPHLQSWPVERLAAVGGLLLICVFVVKAGLILCIR